MALNGAGPNLEIAESAQTFYDVNDRLFVAIYDCQNCLFGMERERLNNQQQNTYDPSYDYTDGYIMHSVIEYATPEPVQSQPFMRSLCFMNESKNYVKTCFGIQWRNDRDTTVEGYYWDEKI